VTRAGERAGRDRGFAALARGVAAFTRGFAGLARRFAGFARCPARGFARCFLAMSTSPRFVRHAQKMPRQAPWRKRAAPVRSRGSVVTRERWNACP
jgi:hypothetical protein